MHNLRNDILRLNEFPSKNGTFDFGMPIGCIDSTLTFCCCYYKYQFGEAG